MTLIEKASAELLKRLGECHDINVALKDIVPRYGKPVSRDAVWRLVDMGKILIRMDGSTYRP